MNKTTLALVARGLDIVKADKLTSAGWTIGKLKLADAVSLKTLGLTANDITLLQSGARPPIPSDTLQSLLFKNRYQCCVCRDPKSSIVVHHIVKWATSKSHDIQNLAVLCLTHHDEAHTTSTLRQNLTANTLRSAKKRWERKVKELDARSIVDALLADGSQWAYINEMRMFELIDDYNLDVTGSIHFEGAKTARLVDGNGRPLPTKTDTFYKYEGPYILTRYGYMKDALLTLIERLPITNISDHLDRGVILPSIIPGDFIYVEGAHSFSRLTNRHEGIGQHCRGTRAANNVDVEFTFDRWEATSSSSLNGWLSGTKRAGSLLQIKDISRVASKVVLTGTVIAISSFTSGLKTRDYAARLFSYRPRRGPPRMVTI